MNTKVEKTVIGSSYFCVADAARFLAISQSMLNHLRLVGGGPRFAKLGGGRNSRIVYRMADLDAWAEARTYTSTSAYPTLEPATKRGGGSHE